MYELCPILVFLAYFCYRVVLVCGDTRDCLEPQVITAWSAGLTHTHSHSSGPCDRRVGSLKSFKRRTAYLWFESESKIRESNLSVA